MSWWCFHLETLCRGREKLCLSCLSSNFVFLDCFCPPLISCCCWNKEPDWNSLSLSSSFRKTSFELFFDFCDCFKWSLNYFPKQFVSLVWNNFILFFSMFLPPEENKHWKTFCTFDGSKSNFLSIIYQMVRFKRLKISSKNKAGASDFRSDYSPTLTLLWIKTPPQSLFLYFSQNLIDS